jgi:hypothetical protein
MVKKLKHKGKTWVEYKKPIGKSWMLALFAGVIWSMINNHVGGFWQILNFIILLFWIVIVQIMYDKELKENKK